MMEDDRQRQQDHWQRRTGGGRRSPARFGDVGSGGIGGGMPNPGSQTLMASPPAVRAGIANDGNGSLGSASKDRRSRTPHRRPRPHPDVAAAEAAALSVLSAASASAPRLRLPANRDIFTKWESIKKSARVAPAQKRSMLRRGGGNGMFAVGVTAVIIPALLLGLIGMFALTTDEGRRHLSERGRRAAARMPYRRGAVGGAPTAWGAHNGSLSRVPLPPSLERMMRLETGVGGGDGALKAKARRGRPGPASEAEGWADEKQADRRGDGKGESAAVAGRGVASTVESRQRPLAGEAADASLGSGESVGAGMAWDVRRARKDNDRRHPTAEAAAEKTVRVVNPGTNETVHGNSSHQNSTEAVSSPKDVDSHSINELTTKKKTD